VASLLKVVAMEKQQGIPFLLLTYTCRCSQCNHYCKLCHEAQQFVLCVVLPTVWNTLLCSCKVSAMSEFNQILSFSTKFLNSLQCQI